ncbi:MAG: M16 family metallopeptidase [Cytophagaceae bacterium]
MLDRSVAPALSSVEIIKLIKPVSFTLDNGIPIHFIVNGKQPVVRLEIILSAGTWFETIPNSSFFFTKLLSSGTKTQNSSQIEEKLAYYGAFLELNPGSDRINITVYCLQKFLVEILALLDDILSNSVFPEAEFQSQKNINIQQLKVNQEKTSFLAGNEFKKALFGSEHPYGRCLTIENIERLNQTNLIEYYRSKLMTSCEAHIIISGGDIDIDYALKEINDKFSHLRNQAVQITEHLPCPSENKRIHIEKPNSLQSSIRVGLPLFTFSHPDYFNINILIDVLGGYFGSRLMKNIREEKGFTYGINASFPVMAKAGYMVIGTDVKTENTEETIEEIYKEIDTLKKDLIPSSELNVLKNYLLGSFANSIGTAFSHADKFKTIYLNELEESFYQNYLNKVKSITSKELLETANKYFINNKFYTVMVGASE